MNDIKIGDEIFGYRFYGNQILISNKSARYTMCFQIDIIKGIDKYGDWDWNDMAKYLKLTERSKRFFEKIVEDKIRILQ